MCPLCRQEPTRDNHSPEEPRREPSAAMNPARPNVELMTNEEVIARLERLLDIHVLRRELEQVSTIFLCLDTSDMGIEKGILHIHRLIDEGDIDLFHCIELDVDCPFMCDDEKQNIQRLFNIMIPRPYRWLRPPRRNSNINFIP